jgi:hypothetical protein
MQHSGFPPSGLVPVVALVWKVQGRSAEVSLHRDKPGGRPTTGEHARSACCRFVNSYFATQMLGGGVAGQQTSRNLQPDPVHNSRGVRLR